jgi:hypothetical protein
VTENAGQIRQTDEFIVEMHEESKTFHVNLEKMLEWLGRGIRRGHRSF